MKRTWARRVALSVLAGVCACAASPPQTPVDSPNSIGPLPGLAEALKDDTPEAPPRDPVAADDSPQFQQAASFDRIAQDQASPDELASARKECRSRRSKALYCPLVRDLKKWKGFVDETDRPLVYHPPAPKVPVAPVVAEGKLSNERLLRKTDVENLLPGLKGLDPITLDLVKERALSDRCPNQLAAALAATLEDGMPDKADPKLLARLYEKSAGCYPRHSSNRENFFTRSGLLLYFAGDFAAAAAVLKKALPQDALVGRAVYWLYRSRLAAGDAPGAESARKRLLSQFPLSFHSLIASLEAGESPEQALLHPETEPKKHSRLSPWVNGWTDAMEALKKYGFLKTSERIASFLSATAKRLEPEYRVYLASYGSPHFRVTRLTELFIRKRKLISTATMKLAYPLAFWPLMERNGLDLDPLLLLAVGRKESKFDPKAVSPANAQGLLQVHPDTAKRLAAQDVDLTNPRVNITLAAHYLVELRRRHEGKLPWMLASYNAGEDAARSWLARFPHADPILQIDLITFRETRNYVGFVLSNYYWYRRLYQPEKGQPFEGLVSAIARK